MATGKLSDWSRRLGSSLVSGGYVSEEDVVASSDQAVKRGVTLGYILAEKGLVPADVVVKTLSELSNLPVVDLKVERPDTSLFAMIPPAVAREFKVIPVKLAGNLLTVASPEPLSLGDLNNLSNLTGREIRSVLADERAIEQYLTSGQMSTQAVSGVAPAPVAAPNVPPPPPVAPPVAPAPVQQVPSTTPEMPPKALLNVKEEKVPVMKDINDLLVYAVEHGSSDLHLTNRLPPAIRVDGAIRPIPNQPALDNETIREMVYGILTQGLRERFEANKELDTSHSIMGVGRFRVNVFQQRGSIGAVFRTIPHEIPPFESLGLPDSVKKVTELRRGLVLVTGPTGSGKSTTLASLISIINQTRPLHIITIEDPIEFLHSHGRSIVNQREVGTDTKSFNEALKHVLRQDPDVILVGEMRDLETIATALTAAETGHLVFATLHTQDAPQTVDRIIDVFPTNQQDQVRIQLAGSLEAVITQQLVVTASGRGRVAIAEVMFATPAIRNLIRSAKTHQIYSLMQTGAVHGMQTMDQGLAKAVKAGLISEGVALDRCHDETELRHYLKAANI